MSSTKRGDVNKGELGSHAKARLALQAAVGDRVRRVRLERGIGQAECARDAGLDKSSMYRLEKGDQNVTIDVLARVALVLGVGLDELVLGVPLNPGLIETDDPV